MNKSPVEVWLWLLLVMRPYSSRTHEILNAYDNDATEAAKAIRDGKVPNLTDEEKYRAKVTRNGDVQGIINLCNANNIKIITMDDEEYPSSLKPIYNPPIVLFCAGTLGNLDNEFSISVVGSRHATNYGFDITNFIVSPLAKLGTVIISGLANGLDYAAHNACLNSGGRTIGVCACGLLVDYPKGSSMFKQKIIQTGGAIISELLPYDDTSKEVFQFRNRIISALSLGTLVIEAGERSGCFLTVTHALEQGKEVFAVPPSNVFNNNCTGTAKLLRDGAVPVFNYLDVLNVFYKNGGLGRYFELDNDGQPVMPSE